MQYVTSTAQHIFMGENTEYSSVVSVFHNLEYFISLVIAPTIPMFTLRFCSNQNLVYLGHIVKIFVFHS